MTNLILAALLPLQSASPSWDARAFDRLGLKPLAHLRPASLLRPGAAAPARTRTGATSLKDDKTLTTIGEYAASFPPGVTVAGSHAPSVASMDTALGDVRRAMAKGDFAAARRGFVLVPRRVAGLSVDPQTLSQVEAEYYQRGALLADEAGNLRETARWLGAFLQSSESPTYRRLYATTLVRLGYDGADVSAYVRRASHEVWAETLEGIVPDLDAAPLAMVAEIVAACELGNLSDRLAILHAERALSIDSHQAGSAIILLLNYPEQGRYADALRVGRAALPYAHGHALNVLKVTLSQVMAGSAAAASRKTSALSSPR